MFNVKDYKKEEKRKNAITTSIIVITIQSFIAVSLDPNVKEGSELLFGFA